MANRERPLEAFSLLFISCTEKVHETYEEQMLSELLWAIFKERKSYCIGVFYTDEDYFLLEDNNGAAPQSVLSNPQGGE